MLPNVTPSFLADLNNVFSDITDLDYALNPVSTPAEQMIAAFAANGSTLNQAHFFGARFEPVSSRDTTQTESEAELSENQSQQMLDQFADRVLPTNTWINDAPHVGPNAKMKVWREAVNKIDTDDRIAVKKADFVPIEVL